MWGSLRLAPINSDWMSNASSGLCINLVIIVVLFTLVLYFASLGVIILRGSHFGV